MNSFSRICAIILIGIIFVACTSRTPKGDANDTLDVLFTGDVLLDRGVRPVAERNGISYIFSEVSPLFRKADAVVVNLECPLTDTVSAVNKKYIFRAKAEWADSLRRVGVTHAAMANNHTNDQGRRGLAVTYQHLRDAGIVPIGYGLTDGQRIGPTVINKGEVSVALFNSVMMTLENWHKLDGKPGVCQASYDGLAKAISEYKQSHPDTWIVAVLHWGSEFQSNPNMTQRRQARRLAEAGADVVIGHHPHVLQPIDTINVTGRQTSHPSLVYYSLGNFVFDQTPPRTKESMIVKLRFLSDGTFMADTISVRIDRCRPVLSHNEL